jgi:hypothetical protein
LIYGLFAEAFPSHFEQSCQVVQSITPKEFTEKLIKAFTNCVLNIDMKDCPAHVDAKDSRNGYCWILAFGDFEGGNLLWSQLNLQFRMGKGALIAFRSFDIMHSVTEVTKGIRNSLVFFIDETNTADAIAISNQIKVASIQIYSTMLTV